MKKILPKLGLLLLLTVFAFGAYALYFTYTQPSVEGTGDPCGRDDRTESPNSQE